MFTRLRTYMKFLSRHKVYTTVSVVGFAISLAFVVILSMFAKTQVSMDSFHENKDRIYMLLRDQQTWQANPLGDYVMNLCPEVETYTRLVNLEQSLGLTEQEWIDGSVLHADPDFFKIFSFPLLEGNIDEVIRTENTVVLSRSTAASLFGNDNPMGRTVYIDKHEMTVSGIFADFPYNTHMVEPAAIVNYHRIRTNWGDDIFESWGNCSFPFYFLEKENADFPSKGPLLLEKFKEDYWIYTQGFSDEVVFLPLEDIYFSDAAFTNLKIKKGSVNTTRIYMGIALLILVIAVLNYINMTVAQAGFRGKEAAVRKLMGSSRSRIILQNLSETFFMTAFALLLALVMALLAEPYFNKVLNTELHLKDQFTAGVTIAIFLGILGLSVIAGIIPALAVASFKPIEVVKGTINRKVKAGYSKVLIVFQFTVCTTLLIGTFIMREQAQYMGNKDVGFNKDNMLFMSNVVGRYGDMGGVKDRLLQVPGVVDVGFVAGSPLDGGNNNSFTVNGAPVSTQVLSADSVGFRLLGLSIEPLSGAQIGDNDLVMYVNRAAYNAITPDSITLRIPGRDDIVIGGILGDLHIRSLHHDIGPTTFRFIQDWSWPWHIVVKLESENIYETAEKVRAAYTEVNGGQSFNWYFADERIHSWYEGERRTATIMGLFTILSVIIMVMGVFAMSLYMIRQKEKEIGLRKVNGATVGQIVSMLNTQSLVRVAIALVIACPLAWYFMNKWLHNFPYRIGISPKWFVVGGVVVVLLCLISVSWQTLRAARANPVDSLKSE